MLREYDQSRKFGSYLHVYKSEAMFKDNFDEFDSARSVISRRCRVACPPEPATEYWSVYREAVQGLVNEYRAAEKENYPDYMDDDV